MPIVPPPEIVLCREYEIMPAKCNGHDRLIAIYGGICKQMGKALVPAAGIEPATP